MALNRYGVPEMDPRSIRGLTGLGGQPTVNAGMDVNQLFAAALSSESYGRALNEEVRRALADRTGISSVMARSGVDPGQTQFANQAAGRIPMVGSPLNPAIETLAVNQMSMAQSRALMDEMFRIQKANEPSGMEKFMGYAAPIAGMAFGGLTGGLAGAAFGGQFGGMLSNMMRSY